MAYYIATALMGWYRPDQIVLLAASAMWGALICIGLWPPVASMMPNRKHQEQGWKILWKQPAVGAGPGSFVTVEEPGSPRRLGSHLRRSHGDLRSLITTPGSPSEASQDDTFAIAPHYPQQADDQGALPVSSKAGGRSPSERGAASKRTTRATQDQCEVIPEDKESSTQHSVLAVPSFEQREAPHGNLAFQVISAAMVACLVTAAVMDYLIQAKKLLVTEL